ncbi:MAG: DUF3833 family protein [Anderseniella sp.]
MLQISPSHTSQRNFDMAKYFTGRTRAWGMFETFGGRVKKSFVADIDGYWQGDRFLLEEDFTFSDGEKETRTWALEFAGDGSFVASCADTPSPGKGTVHVNGSRLSYSMNLRVGTSRMLVSFSDLFHQIDESTVLNRARVKKFGIPIGQVIIAFRKA